MVTRLLWQCPRTSSGSFCEGKEEEEGTLVGKILVKGKFDESFIKENWSLNGDEGYKDKNSCMTWSLNWLVTLGTICGLKLT